MATKKVGKVGRVPDVSHQPPPVVAIGSLSVSAQGAILKGDERLMFAVRVLDDAGKPVTGLKDHHFKVWQLGHFFSEIGDTFAVELGEIDGLEGITTWSDRSGPWCRTARFPSPSEWRATAPVPARR